MSYGNISAGTGPAAVVLIGGLLLLGGNWVLGIILIAAGIGLSLIWAGHFKRY
jgi:hypothetical protein